MTVAAAFYPPNQKLLPPPPEPVDWWDVFQENRNMGMPRQVRDWTCSACSIDWVLRATGVYPECTREWVVGELGFGEYCGPGVGISPSAGLCNSQAAIRVLERFFGEGNVVQEWLGFDRAYEIATQSTGLLNSTAWYHYVALRGVIGDKIWVANSAPGYPSWNPIQSEIGRYEFDRFKSFQAIWIRR